MISVGSTLVLPEEKRLVAQVLNSNQLSPAKFVRKFEQEFSRIHEIKHSLFMNSGTDALRIALATLKEVHRWKDGDEVLVPSMTFVATLNTVLQVGLKPLLVDVGMYDYNLNPYLLKRKSECSGISDRVKAIVIAHLFGQPANMEPLLEFARQHKLKVIEDSCETMFVRYKDKLVGTFGDISCFSTYSCHCLSTGVGGLACTNNDEYATIMRSYMNHGRDPAYIPGYSRPKTIKAFVDKHFRYERIGYSSRATELQAAIGLGQLKVYKQMLLKRQKNAEYLNIHLLPLWAALQMPEIQHDREHAYMMYPLVIKQTDQGKRIKKKDLMHYLMRHGIECRDMMPIINQPCYEGLFDSKGYPVAEHFHSNGFYIGCHSEMKTKDLNKIVRVLTQYILPYLTK